MCERARRAAVGQRGRASLQPTSCIPFDMMSP